MRTASSSSSAARRILSLPTTVRTSLPEELEDKLSQRCHAIHEILVSQEGNKIVAEVYPYYEDYGKEADQLIKDAVNQFNRDMPRWKNIDKLEFRSEEFPKTTTLKIRRNYKELEKAGKI